MIHPQSTTRGLTIEFKLEELPPTIFSPTRLKRK